MDLLGVKYNYYVNDHRQHGFFLDAKTLRGKLVIAADFAIKQETMQYLVDNDVVVLSTDHHDIQSEFIDVRGKNGCEGVVINNQYPFEPEEDKYLSGAGVFYELICSFYPDFKTKVRTALVGITLLSDMRPTEGDKAKSYLRQAFNIDPSTPYINYLIKSTLTSDFGFGVPRLDRNFIDFTLSPTINALLRYNRTNEAIDFILGKGIGHGSEYRHSQQLLLQAMSTRMRLLDMPSVSVLAVFDTDFYDFPDVEISDFIGLLCSDYKDKHGGKSTLGFSISNGVITRASFRGKYDGVHYLNGFNHIGVDADGHPNAFGIKNFSPTVELWTQISDLVSDLESMHETTITVVDVNNMALAMNKYGSNFATDNCYVRDCCRYYFRYTGLGAKIVRETYKTEPLSESDILNGVEPETVVKGVGYKYLRDVDGNKIPKYIEYLVDGRKVKSFGVKIEDGIILPIYEKGYIEMYIRPMLV